MKTEIVKNGTSEAICGARYFLFSNNEFNLAKNAAAIDIGGGTTDISYFAEHNLRFQDSVKFAGGNFLSVTGNLNALIGDSAEYDQAMRRWPFVKDDWDGKIAAFTGNPKSVKVIRNIGVFYGSICYYLGLHFKRENLTDPVEKIAFAGNGVRFMQVLTLGNVLSQNSLSEWVDLFRGCLAAGHGVSSKSYNTSFFFSPRPKLEVAQGLVVDAEISDPAGPGKSTKKMLGLDLQGAGVAFKFSDWPEDIHAIDLTQYDIDLTVLKSYVQAYNDSLKGPLKAYRLPALDPIIEQTISNRIKRNLELRGARPLVNPLYFEAIEVLMDIYFRKA